MTADLLLIHNIWLALNGSSSFDSALLFINIMGSEILGFFAES